MREILFRGKRVGNGEWINGFLSFGNKIVTVRKCYDWRTIYVCDSVEEYKIDEKTVGQFTGLTDKNGKKIFEGDIVKVKSEYVDETIYFIYYRDCGFKLIYKPSNGVVNLTNNKSRNIEVIGNIHDNPELLEVQNG